jgi:hypothetical protein
MTGHPSDDPDELAEWLSSLGLKRLSPAWAKAEIVVGLTAAVAGSRFLGGEGPAAPGGGVLVVLGVYLAMAGHRSHIYQAMNRQNARLASLIRSSSPAERDRP